MLVLVRGDASDSRHACQANRICIVLKRRPPSSCPALQFDLQPLAPGKFIELCCHETIRPQASLRRQPTVP